MRWIWSSYDEFKEYITPIEITKSSYFRVFQMASLFDQQKLLFEAFNELSETYQMLQKEKFVGDSFTDNSIELKRKRQIIWQIVNSGERILLYHKRLALSHWARDFIYEKDLNEHWDRFIKTGRLNVELKKLIEATDNLLKGFQEITYEDTKFIIDDINLPGFLKTDFILARDLFSVGLDHSGVLILGRGLEGVLQEIARKKEIKIKTKNKEYPAHETKFYDLIEIFYQLQWAENKSRFIDKQTKSLLHYLRDLRNSKAHPNFDTNDSQNEREIAMIITKTVQSLWESANRKRARLVKKVIEKEW